MSNKLSSLPTIDDCVHCGLCLSACPTYERTHRESQSPRGRIAALRLLAEGQPLTPGLEEGLADCLVCRSCESACPAGVSMESLMSGYRAHRRQTGRARGLEKAMAFFLDDLIAHPDRLGHITTGLRVFGGILRRLGLELPSAERLRPVTIPATTSGGRGRVAIIAGCVNRTWFSRELLASQRLLENAGWEVVIPEIRCCGALHHHAGLDSDGLARETAAAVRRVGADFIVCDVAGCAAFVHGTLPHVRDTPTLLVDQGGVEVHQPVAGDWRVAPPCQHRHGPLPEVGLRQLLDQILIAGYRELPGPDHCCGAAGSYVLERSKASRAQGKQSLARLPTPLPTGVLTGNSGCLLRWEHLLCDLEVQVWHPLRLLETALLEESS